MNRLAIHILKGGEGHQQFLKKGKKRHIKGKEPAQVTRRLTFEREKEKSDDTNSCGLLQQMSKATQEEEEEGFRHQSGIVQFFFVFPSHRPASAPNTLWTTVQPSQRLHTVPSQLWAAVHNSLDHCFYTSTTLESSDLHIKITRQKQINLEVSWDATLF